MKDIESVREYDPHKRWRDSQVGVVRAWKWAVRIGGGLLGTLIVGPEVLRVLTIPFSTSNLLFLILFAMQALFIVLWIWVTESELRLLAQWLDPLDYEPPSGQTQMIEKCRNCRLSGCDACSYPQSIMVWSDVSSVFNS